MNWKPTALFSTATVLATWLASGPPPAPMPAAAPASAPTPTITSRTVSGVRVASRQSQAATDIETQADRLLARLVDASPYVAPGRNPFRFGATTPRLRVTAPAPAPPAVSDVVAVAAPVVRVALVGVAEDTVGEVLVRTAIVSLSGDVALVREGDSLDGGYRVARVGDTFVELTRTADGATLRLGLTP